MPGCSIVSIGRNGFTEILELGQIDWQLIELYKKICANKDGMIFIMNGGMIDFEVKNNNVIVLRIEDIEEAYKSCIGYFDEEYYMELIDYIRSNYSIKDLIESGDIVEF